MRKWEAEGEMFSYARESNDLLRTVNQLKTKDLNFADSGVIFIIINKDYGSFTF